MRRWSTRSGAFLLLGSLAIVGRVRADDGPATAPAPAPAPAANAPAPDAFADAMAAAKLTVDEVGFRPRASWARYPVDPPFKMPFFDDLLAHPLDTYEFTRTLGNAVEDLLTPTRLTASPEKDKPEALYSLAVILGMDHRIGGFRGFGMGLLDQEVDPKDPLGDAFRRLDAVAALPAHRAALDPTAPAEPNMGPATGGAGDLPDALKLPLARLLVELAESIRWIEIGLRNVSPELRRDVWAALPTLATSTPDAGTYFPAIEDAAHRIDSISVGYGSLKALAAVQRARREFAAADAKVPLFYHWMHVTPFGQIDVVGEVTSDTSCIVPATPFLYVAFGDSFSVSGDLGATTPRRPLSVALLLGDDHGGVRKLPGNCARGVLGCGILYSGGVVRTEYTADVWGLGAGLLGVGVLVDEGGDDVYRIREAGEGAGYFGAGLLLDAAGNDRYELLAGDGQGYGGPGGIGVLADHSGNDTYYAEPLPAKAGQDRADYHSDQKYVGSNAQGAGMGRRGDINDGHAWAGGLGALIDVDGDDHYTAGNFSQGVGYWFGTGLLYDGGGNDVYDSVYFSHGSGAHFAIGAVVDEGGDDVHRLSDLEHVGLGPKAGAGIAFGWDVVNAFVIDRAGNDRYEADIISEGVSDIRSFALLLDEGGDDVYVAHAGAAAFGAVDEQPTYLVPHRTSPFAFHLPQTAMLIDLGGRDRYLRVPDGGGDPVADLVAGDDRSWSREAKVGPGAGRNVVVAADVARGRAGFLDAWPRRVSSPSSPSTSKTPGGK